MLKLRELDGTSKDAHLKLLKKRISDSLDRELLQGHSLAAYAELLFDFLKQNLDSILVGAPSNLVSIVNEVKNQFPGFHRQCARRRLKNPPAQQVADAKTVDAVERCFDYPFFAQKSSEWGAYLLVSVLSVRLCPYCQLHHVNYHLAPEKKSFSLRPPLDHYFPRALYPYLAVSLSNLVPCCSQCNSGIKLALDPLGLGLAHPGDVNKKMLVSFSAVGSIPARAGGRVDAVKLSIVTNDPASKAHVGAFKLEERYQWYRHEVFDLMRQFERAADLPKNLRKVVHTEEYVLGFSRSNKEERALGLCLVNVYDELKANIIA